MTTRSAAQSKTLTSGDAVMVSVWKVIEYLGLAAYILYFPRAMSLNEFGELAVVVAVTSLFWIASSLGAQSVFGRFFPEFLESGNMLGLRVLYSQMCISRLLFIVVLAGFFPLLLVFFIPGLSATESWLATAVFVLGALSSLFYQLQFGLNNLARWMFRDSSAKLFLVLALILIGVQPTLDRVLQWMLVFEAAYFLVGLYWSWSYFYIGTELKATDTLRTGLKFGLTFFFSNLLILSVWRTGEMMLAKLSPDDALAAVAQFSVANSIAYTLYGLFAQLSVLLVPSLTTFFMRGDAGRKQRWLAALLKYTSLVIVISMLIIYSAGDMLIGFVFGSKYEQTASLLYVLLAALIPLMVMRVAMALAMVRKDLRAIFAITLPTFTGFVVAGVVLSTLYGAFGAAVALFVAALIGAVVAVLKFDLWSIIQQSALIKILLLGVLATGVEYSDMLPVWYGLALSLFVFVCGALMLGVVTLADMRLLRQLR